MFKFKSAVTAPRPALPRKSGPTHSVADLVIENVSLHSDGKLLVIKQENPEARVTIAIEYLPDIRHYLANLSGRCERRAFRVPVYDAFGLKARIGHAGKAQIPARILDISYTGALVELGNWDAHDFAIGTRLTLELRLEGLVYRNEPVVHRTPDEGYGLFFPESLTAEDVVDPPDSLLKMVRRLEEMWVASRTQRQ